MVGTKKGTQEPPLDLQCLSVSVKPFTPFIEQEALSEPNDYGEVPLRLSPYCQARTYIPLQILVHRAPMSQSSDQELHAAATKIQVACGSAIAPPYPRPPQPFTPSAMFAVTNTVGSFELCDKCIFVSANAHNPSPSSPPPPSSSSVVNDLALHLSIYRDHYIVLVPSGL